MPVTINGTTGVAGVDGSAGTPSYQGGDTNTGMFFPAADTIAFAEGGAEVMRIDSSGNLLVGATSNTDQSGTFGQTIRGPAPGLTFVGTEASARTYTIYEDTGSLRIYDRNATAERMRIDSSGNLLVGTTNTSESAGNGLKLLVGSTPGYKVVTPASTASSASFMSYSSGAGAYRFYVTDAGVINATSTSITAISDASLKENVRDLETGLAQVMDLRPRRFDWKEETQIGEKNVAGFIAQEVEAVLPELVYEYKYSEDVTKKSLKMGDILPTLVKAIQELKAELDTAKARIAALEAA